MVKWLYCEMVELFDGVSLLNKSDYSVLHTNNPVTIQPFGN